jgi:hypothetical protein
MRNEADVLALIAADPWMMAVLETARSAGLPDCWLGAGFVRRKVWDHLHGFNQATPLEDVDLLYFQPGDIGQDSERAIEAGLRSAMPEVPWSVKNQARMHLRNGDQSYTNTIDAMRYWLETPTCVAARLAEDGRLELAAPYGIDDLLHMIVRPTPAGQRRAGAYRKRLEGKNWLRQWPWTQAIWPRNG